MNIKETIISAIALLLLIAGGVYLGNSFKESKVNPIKVGSIIDGQGYQSTTTSTTMFATEALLTSSPTSSAGILGHVVITGAAAGQIIISDATTSNINLRSADQSSTTIRLADIPVSAAAGTYVFDVVFKRGLYISTVGTMPTTTITWKY